MTSGPGGGCFTAETKIELENGKYKKIIDVKVGDALRSAFGEVVTVKGKLVLKDKIYKYSINNGPYFVSDSHPFLTNDGWKSINPAMTKKEMPSLEVQQLKVGDKVFKKDGVMRIESIKMQIDHRHVYNLEVSGDHTFRANDYKVHNIDNQGKGGTTAGGCSGGVGPGGTDIEC